MAANEKTGHGCLKFFKYTVEMENSNTQLYITFNFATND